MVKETVLVQDTLGYLPKVVVCNVLPAVVDRGQSSKEDRPLPDVPVTHPACWVAVQAGGEDGPCPKDGREAGPGGVVVQGHTLHLALQLDRINIYSHSEMNRQCIAVSYMPIQRLGDEHI